MSVTPGIRGLAKAAQSARDVAMLFLHPVGKNIAIPHLHTFTYADAKSIHL